MINARQHIDQFYATPPDAARRAFQGIDLKGVRNVLDPSCGTGAFLSELPIHQGSFYGYEIDPDRYNAAKGRDYGSRITMTMLGEDFLHQSEGIAPIIDLVTMNPPFNKGPEHFLRAYDLMMSQPQESTIVCLLNKASIDNPAGPSKRRMLQVIEQHGGTVEGFGQCFKGVRAQVACIRITVPGRTMDRDWSGAIDWDQWETLKDGNASTDLVPYTQGVDMPADELLLMVDAYNAAIKVHADHVRLYGELDRLASICTGKQDYLVDYSSRGRGLNANFHQWRMEFTKTTWLNLLDRCTRGEMMSTSVRNDIVERFTEGHAGLAFSLKNIKNLFQVLMGIRPVIIQDTIKQVFEFITWHSGGQGDYRHNRRFKMAPKFIISCALERFGTYRIHWQKRDAINAIDKMLCLLSGNRFNEIKTIEQTVTKAINDGFPTGGKHAQGVDTEFFKVVWYENGNLRFWVKESAAPFWSQANQEAGKIKGQPLGNGSDWKVNHKWAPND